MQRYKVTRAADVTRDLGLIEEHLFRSYQHFGEDRETAQARAAERIEDILIYMRSFATHPHRGTEHNTIRPGVRTATHKNFVLYFEIDEASFEVRILAAFFGGADHRHQIIDRLRS